MFAPEIIRSFFIIVDKILPETLQKIQVPKKFNPPWQPLQSATKKQTPTHITVCHSNPDIFVKIFNISSEQPLF